jgi:thioredoxin 1
MNQPYSAQQPARAEIDGRRGLSLLQFGTNWCGHCRAAQSPVSEALADHPEVRHIKVEDGSGRVLGRSYAVTLWPTLVFLRDGQEVGRLVRPVTSEPVREQLRRLASGPD